MIGKRPFSSTRTQNYQNGLTGMFLDEITSEGINLMWLLFLIRRQNDIKVMLHAILEA